MSKENLALLDAENVIIWTASPSADVEAEAQGILATLLEDPLWNTLESTKNGRLFIVGSHWQGFGIFEAHAALDDLFRYVLGVDPQEVSPNPFLVSEEAASTEAVYPLTVTHNLGTIEIPAQPERIVALGIGDIATVYGLGLTPVAISSNPYAADGLWPWLEGVYDAAKTEIITYNEPSFEQIIALQPDIILANNLFTIANIYTSLAEIAPTTAPAATDATGDTWQQLTLSIGHVLGLDAEAQAAVDETEARIAAVVANYPNLAGKTFSLSFLHAPGALNSINAPSDYAVQFFQSLGFVVTPALADLVAGQSGVQAALSLETLNLIDADLVVVAFGSPDVQAEYEANPLYQNLEAVKDGRLLVVDLNTVVQLRGPNVLGIRWVLDQIEPALAGLN